jgi:hypothetical protein
MNQFAVAKAGKQLQGTSSSAEGGFRSNNKETILQRYDDNLDLGRSLSNPLMGEFKLEPKPNLTGMPDKLKTGIESLSGIDISDVRVHVNSDKPAQMNVLAYAQGRQIYMGPGLERYLPHEAWHVVQQAQGRVKPNIQKKNGISINDDPLLEKEADAMGEIAATSGREFYEPIKKKSAFNKIIQAQTPVNKRVSQKLLEDAAGGSLGGTEFSWDSKFDVEIKDKKVLVTIRVMADHVDDETFKKNWASKISEKWSNRFMIKTAQGNYPIVVNLVRAKSGEREHYRIRPIKSGKVRSGRGHFGTENMTSWGVNDVFDVPHEVGHMLGNTDEYGILEVGGIRKDYKSDPSNTIMGIDTSKYPVAEHYHLIEEAARKELSGLETSVVPDPISRLARGTVEIPASQTGLLNPGAMVPQIGMRVPSRKPSPQIPSRQGAMVPQVGTRVPPRKPLPQIPSRQGAMVPQVGTRVPPRKPLPQIPLRQGAMVPQVGTRVPPRKPLPQIPSRQGAMVSQGGPGARTFTLASQREKPKKADIKILSEAISKGIMEEQEQVEQKDQ